MSRSMVQYGFGGAQPDGDCSVFAADLFSYFGHFARMALIRQLRTTATVLLAVRNECSNALMANYFSGRGTVQMRLTVFLIGAAALIGGILVSMHQIQATTTNEFVGAYKGICGTTFAPRDSSSPFEPHLAEDCYSAIVSWQIGGVLLFLVAGFFSSACSTCSLVPKSPANRRPHSGATEGFNESALFRVTPPPCAQLRVRSRGYSKRWIWQRRIRQAVLTMGSSSQ
jgi:hypothetical protein